MAVVNTKSSSITNRDATPAVASNSRLTKANVMEGLGVVAVANGDSIASTLRCTSIPSNARISQVLLSCTAITSGAGDIGLYQTADNGGAVVDADFFGSAVSIATALSNSDVTRESGIVTVANMELPVWQALGLTADPVRDYDVVITLTAATTAAGAAALTVRYTV
jgi:hypothetical protein